MDKFEIAVRAWSLALLCVNRTVDETECQGMGESSDFSQMGHRSRCTAWTAGTVRVIWFVFDFVVAFDGHAHDVVFCMKLLSAEDEATAAEMLRRLDFEETNLRILQSG